MNQHLQHILNFIQQNENLSDEEKNTLSKSLKDADKELEITAFKLDRTEKVKRTTAILLEETIEELEHKRKAVEAQNRELEIETSLERVRTVAMSMNKPDDMLDVCKNISLQLQSLGVKEIRNVQTAIFYEKSGTYMNYEYYAKHDKTLITETIYTNHEIAKAFAAKMLKGKGEVSITLIKGEEKVKEWLAYQKSTNVFIDTFLETALSLNYYWFSLGPVALGISAYVILNDHELGLFKRFLNVFELAYRRYLDIEKAIAQAKEAQIETSLERVRAQAMAMRAPSDLTDICQVLFTELHSLGFSEMRNAMINIHDDEKETFVNYDYSDEIGKSINHLVYNIHPVIEKQIKEMRSAGDAFSETYFKGKDLEDWKTFRKEIGEKDDLRIEQTDALYYYFYSIGSGSIGISTFSIVAGEKLEVLKRFRNVFTLAYQRYADIAQAEAQAKEAKIEAALERTRTQSMIMQHSNELDDTLRVFHEQVLLLGIHSAFSFLWLPDEKNDRHIFWAVWAENNSTVFKSKSINYPLDRNEPATAQCLMDWKSNEPVYSYHVPPTEVGNYFAVWQELIDEVKQLKPEYFSDGLYYVEAFIRYGCFGVMVTTDLTEDEKKLLSRFAIEFERTYTRFLDLQKAEAQTREAQIELALERVRARTMAMQHSNELPDAATILFQQVQSLGMPAWSAGYCTWNEDKSTVTLWMSSEGVLQPPFTAPTTEDELFIQMRKGQEDGKTFHVVEMGGEKLVKHYQYMRTLPVVGEILDSINTAGHPLPAFQIMHHAYFSKGFLLFITYEPVPDAHEIFKRFGKVFDQTYTRFLDLQKAEAQAREAEIELGLERVRARAMAMQNSDELKELIGTVFIELTRLDLVLTRCLIMIYDPKSNDSTWWMANSEAPSDPIGLVVQYHEFPSYLAYLKAWQERKLKWQYILEGTVKKEWDDFLFVETELSHLPDFVIAGMKAPDRVYLNASFNTFGNLTLATLEPLSDEHFDILLRFAKVFDLTYTRFNDLQKAEAQIREARIEAVLERVRSRTMAMQKSDELTAVAGLLFEQVSALGIKTWTAGFNVWSEDNNSYVDYITSPNGGFIEPYTVHTETAEALRDISNARKSGVEFDVQYVEGEKIKQLYLALTKLDEKQYEIMLQDGVRFPSHQYEHFVFGSKVSLMFITYEPVPEAHDIFKRLGKVFEQTYTRFLDLQKAEAQAREATIEAALEKVRGKAMAMHNSNDLSVTASMVFTELRKLGINPIRCGVGLLNKESRKGQLYSATSSKDGDSLALVGWVVLSGHPVLTNFYDTWLKNEEYYPELSGEQLKSYYELLLSGLSVPVPSDTGQKQYGTFLPFSVGCLYAWSETPYKEAEVKILKRFATIIDLTFRRYIELQKSEASAKEAIKQSALDRIRADIASMRTTNDLERITPLIWNELNILGVPFIRCGIFIMDESQQLIHTFLSTPEGKAIAAFHLPYTTPGNIAQVLSHWHHKKNYTDHWDESAFTEFADMLVKEGGLASAEQYLKTIPQGGFYLHFLPFLQGMLYVGNSTQLSEAEIKLIQSVADAFSTAYARYEDFNKLEAAKQTVEKTLVDLKQAQTQLVQSEKMASLGELTAGIAHEIQNPLNFVNNFSDVSTELVDEMNEEMAKGNLEEAKQIAQDLKQNLAKINHHGRRAGDIVKGMLQHSRTSSGQKEPTDINALADEYLRLAYHGLRAKDKSFNATMKTDFDDTIGNINIIPQDIGRVILNLITNAFYVVDERKKQQPAGYEPTVTVSTGRSPLPWRGAGGEVLIKVTDNGNGIPQKILDKIFQPFFTTKPTGQGTGLGLSLSYDIVKAHGGEIKVNTKENEGTEFTISLPA